MLGFVVRNEVLVDSTVRVEPVASPYHNVSLLDARKDQCKFPLWGVNEKNGHVCGAKRAHEKSSFCEHHEAIVYRERPSWHKEA